MNLRSRFMKVRVNAIEYKAIQKEADALGKTVSEYVRDTLTSVHTQLDVTSELRAIRACCEAAAATVIGAESQTSESTTSARLTLEAVLLLRELAAARDAQILARVRAQLSHQTNQGGNA